MKCKIKVIGLILVIALILTTTVFATVGSRTVELWYKNIKLQINGKEVVPTDANGNTIEPFIIDGTTYLPVRGVVSALGMNVNWDANTSTITLDNPGIFRGGVIVYEDKYVTIEFIGCREPSKDDWFDYYFADFNIKNKTDVTLTFQPKAISFNGISYQFSGSEEIAPQSIGKVSFSTADVIPTNGISKTSGQVSVIDLEDTGLFEDNWSHTAKWVEITQK